MSLAQVQALLNCGQAKAGDCDGGSLFGTVEFLQSFDVPVESCQAYIADSSSASCTAQDICENCLYDSCWAVESTEDATKEISTRGYPAVGAGDFGLLWDESTMVLSLPPFTLFSASTHHPSSHWPAPSLQVDRPVRRPSLVILTPSDSPPALDR